MTARRGCGQRWCAAATDDGLTGAVISLDGNGRPAFAASTGTSPFGRHAVTPYLEIPTTGTETVVVSAHVLTANPIDLDAFVHFVRVGLLGGRAVRLDFDDGEVYVVQLFRPAPCTSPVAPSL